MISTIPGRDIDPNDPPPESSPSLVSPAVLFMTSENAPNATVINASGGKYSRAQMYVNKPINLGVGTEFEDLQAEAETLMDLSSAKPRETGRQS